MKICMDKLIVPIIIFSVALCLICLTKFNVANGQTGTINEAMGNGNDTAYAIYNLDSLGEPNVWFNITAKVFKINPPLPSYVWLEVHHIGDSTKPLVVYYPITLNVGSHNISKWLRTGDCIRITGTTGVHMDDEQSFSADSIDRINCAKMPTFLPIPSELIYNNKYMGIKFKYPRTWHWLSAFTGFEEEHCKKFDVSCVLKLQPSYDNINEIAGINIIALRGPQFEGVCNCSSLQDFIRLRYDELNRNQSNEFSFVNDNMTITTQHLPVWQMEYDMYDTALGVKVRNWEIYAIVNGTYYVTDYYADLVSYAKFLPQVKTIINSLQFIPIYHPKIPSFMQFKHLCHTYSMEFTSDWTPDNNNTCDNAHWSLSNKNGRLFIVPIEQLLGDTKYLTQEEKINAYSKFKDTYYDNPELSQFESSQRTISNISSYETSYTENSEKGFFKHLEEFIASEKGGWIIHYYASGNDFESGLPDVERVLSSFKVVK